MSNERANQCSCYLALSVARNVFILASTCVQQGIGIVIVRQRFHIRASTFCRSSSPSHRSPFAIFHIRVFFGVCPCCHLVSASITVHRHFGPVRAWFLVSTVLLLPVVSGKRIAQKQIRSHAHHSPVPLSWPRYHRATASPHSMPWFSSVHTHSSHSPSRRDWANSNHPKWCTAIIAMQSVQKLTQNDR